MLLIIGQGNDLSTSIVMDWLHYSGYPFLFLHENSIIENLNIEFSKEEEKITFEIDGKLVSLNDFKAIWHRRGKLNFSLPENILSSSRFPEIEDNISNQLDAINEYVGYFSKHKNCVGSFFSDSRCNKVKNLSIARRCGLDIPFTCLLNKKSDLVKIKNQIGRVISKATNKDLFVKDGHLTYGSFGPVKIDDELLNSLGDKFSISLFQGYVDKLFEIRVFYWVGKMWSMAIFSQSDPGTELDYRSYNYSKPNRMVPYKLPPSVEDKLRLFMNEAGFNTGSIDLIYAKSGGYYFLEVNPVGQFNFLSVKCNYNIEKEIADYFIQLT